MKLQISDYVKERINDFFWKWRRRIPAFLSALVLVAYIFCFKINIRSNISNIVALLSAVLGVVTLIFTILLFLKSQKPFNRAMKTVDNSSFIYQYLCSIIVTDLLAMTVVVCIGFFKTIGVVVKYILVFTGVYTFSYSFYGMLFVLYWIIKITSMLDSSDEEVTDE